MKFSANSFIWVSPFSNRSLDVLDKVKGTEEEMVGVKIIRRSLEEPLRQIAHNSGVDGSVVLNKVLTESKTFGFGYNAETNEYEDLLKAGVIDPTKVTRTALENAASIAGLLLTTEAVIAEKPDDKKGQMMPQMPGGGMEGMY